MKELKTYLKDTRLSQDLLLKDVVAKSGIDGALLSKYESGLRLPSERHIRQLADALAVDYQLLRARWRAEQLVQTVSEEIDPGLIWSLAEPRVEYLKKHREQVVPEVSEELAKKLAHADKLRDQWQKTKPLNSTQLTKLKAYFDLQYIFNSNKIEGNTLTLHETALVVEQGLTIGGKSVREHLEAINHAEAVEYLADLISSKVDFSERELLQLHHLILKGIDRLNAGRYRTAPVRISGSSLIPPDHFQLAEMMEDYFGIYRRVSAHVHPIILAADMHERLVTIHPFIDGNGRTARLIMNLILMKHGFTICNLKGDDTSRLAYYKALEQAQADNDTSAFYDLIADAVILSLEAHLSMI